MRFLSDESGILAQEAMGVVFAAMVVGVGAIVFYNFVANAPVIAGNRGDGTAAGSDTAVRNLTATNYNSTNTNIATNTSTSFTLLTIGLLVAGATAILVVVLVKLGRIGGGGMGGA